MFHYTVGQFCQYGDAGFLIKFIFGNDWLEPASMSALLIILLFVCLLHSPPPLLSLCTRIIVHAQTAAQQQSDGSYGVRMFGKCGEPCLS